MLAHLHHDVAARRVVVTATVTTPGAGIVHTLMRHDCGLSCTAEIVAYLADHSAR